VIGVFDRFAEFAAVWFGDFNFPCHGNEGLIPASWTRRLVRAHRDAMHGKRLGRGPMFAICLQRVKSRTGKIPAGGTSRDGCCRILVAPDPNSGAGKKEVVAGGLNPNHAGE
jgi:hypothetical protein